MSHDYKSTNRGSSTQKYVQTILIALFILACIGIGIGIRMLFSTESTVVATVKGLDVREELEPKNVGSITYFEVENVKVPYIKVQYGNGEIEEFRDKGNLFFHRLSMNQQYRFKVKRTCISISSCNGPRDVVSIERLPTP